MTAQQTHPAGLPYLFLTEMWERFGFYVVQGMLILYMTKGFHFTDDKSFTILGMFTACAYIAPFIGGFIADKFIGFRNAILWGSVFLSIGYALLTLPGQTFFYFALATIIVGNGLLKSNISSLLGLLYEEGNPLRESGFTIFYIGINIGVLIAGFSSGFIKDHFGWHAGFGLASIGLLIGLITFLMGYKKMPAALSQVGNTLTLKSHLVLLTSASVACALICFFLQNRLFSQWLLPLVGLSLLIGLVYLAYQLDAEPKKRFLLLITLILSSIVFWGFFFQLFFSTNLYIERLVDRQIFSFTIPTTAFYALESIFILSLGPGFVWSWQTLNRANINPSPFLKFVSAIGCIGFAFFILSLSTHFASNTHLVNPLWIMLAYFFLTVGELLLSPIGLSAVTTLAPRHLIGIMMGVWFVALGFGGQFAGWLAKLAIIPEDIHQINQQLAIYGHAFLVYGYIASSIAGLFLLMYFALTRSHLYK